MIYLFTEASYEQPFEVEFLREDPSFEHNEYFDFVQFLIIGNRPFSGTVTKIPLEETVTLAELHLYGSSRLGIKTPNLPITQRRVNYTYANNYGDNKYLVILDSRDEPLANPGAGSFFEHEKGLKQYELSNHLGNVLVVFGDKKVSHESLTTGGEVGHYTASLLSIHDNYPGGMPMGGRSLNLGEYRYGHNTQESDAEITGNWGSHYTAEHWMYDSRIQRRWEIDPVVRPWESSYSTFYNNAVLYADFNGDSGTVVLHVLTDASGRPGMSEEYMNKVRDEILYQYREVQNIDISVDIKYGNAPLSKEEFMNRPGSHSSDHYLLYGTADQISEFSKTANECYGWSSNGEIDYPVPSVFGPIKYVNTFAGEASGHDNFALMNIDNLKTRDAIYGARVAMHEKGHWDFIKFTTNKYDPTTYVPYDKYQSPGTAGHTTNRSIMDETSTNFYFTTPQREALVRKHGIYSQGVERNFRNIPHQPVYNYFDVTH